MEQNETLENMEE